MSIDAAGRAWVSATTPRKGRRRPASRLVRIEPGDRRVSGSVALGTDGGGGLGVSPDGTHAIVAPGAKLRGIHRKAALVDLTKRRVIAPPADRRRPRPGDLVARRHAALRQRQRPPARSRSSSAATGTRLRTLARLGTPGALVVQPGLALLTGTEGPDTLNGTRGDDRLVGLGGDDLLRGMRGDDMLEGGARQRHALDLERQRHRSTAARATTPPTARPATTC